MININENELINYENVEIIAKRPRGRPQGKKLDRTTLKEGTVIGRPKGKKTDFTRVTVKLGRPLMKPQDRKPNVKPVYKMKENQLYKGQRIKSNFKYVVVCDEVEYKFKTITDIIIEFKLSNLIVSTLLKCYQKLSNNVDMTDYENKIFNCYPQFSDFKKINKGL